MSDLLKYNEVESNGSEREILSTVKEAGVGAKILLSKANLKKEVQTYADGGTGYNRVVVMLRKADNTQLKLICSKPVSQGIRSKDITVSNLRAFPIGEHITLDGTAIPQIQMPTGAGFEEFGAADGEVQAYQAESTNPEDYVAF
tara:strand:- start:379 stop:810 length:432 start_codon:yes stop_codon:yes gene_type:complete